MQLEGGIHDGRLEQLPEAVRVLDIREHCKQEAAQGVRRRLSAA